MSCCYPIGQLTEDFFERHGLEQAQDRIEKRRAEIQKERERIGQMRDVIWHRRELEQIRKKNDKEAQAAASKQPQTETVKSRAGVERITNQRGKGRPENRTLKITNA